MVARPRHAPPAQRRQPHSRRRARQRMGQRIRAGRTDSRRPGRCRNNPPWPASGPRPPRHLPRQPRRYFRPRPGHPRLARDAHHVPGDRIVVIDQHLNPRVLFPVHQFPERVPLASLAFPAICRCRRWGADGGCGRVRRQPGPSPACSLARSRLVRGLSLLFNLCCPGWRSSLVLSGVSP